MWPSVPGDGRPLCSAIVTVRFPIATPPSNSNSFFKPRTRSNHFAVRFGFRTANPKCPTTPRVNGIFLLISFNKRRQAPNRKSRCQHNYKKRCRQRKAETEDQIAECFEAMVKRSSKNRGEALSEKAQAWQKKELVSRVGRLTNSKFSLSAALAAANRRLRSRRRGRRGRCLFLLGRFLLGGLFLRGVGRRLLSR